MTSPSTVGILGGMGPAAGADFARLFVQACTRLMNERGIPVRDQNFPEHWLAQVPVPDRTLGLQLQGHSAQQPLEPMLQAMGKLAALGARTVAIACNTAHAWHAAMQARFPQVDVLHVADEVARGLAAQGVPAAALLATQGTYDSGVYERSLHEAGVVCHTPSTAEREMLMAGIYDGVKAGDMAFAHRCFSEVAEAMVLRHGVPVLILGCTEIPLALEAVPRRSDVRLVNPAALLAEALALRAYGPAIPQKKGGAAVAGKDAHPRVAAAL
jgi:aspartate racemase